MRFRTSVLCVMALALGCEAATITTSPGCHASVLHERVVGSSRLRTVLLVIDPSLREVLDDARVASLRVSLGEVIEMLVTGDRQLDGDRDFSVDEAVRLAVTTTDGRVLLGAVPLPSGVPARARPVLDPWIEVWPDVDTAWTDWFVEVTAQRVRAALSAPAIEGASPVRSVLALAESTPSLVEPEWPLHVVFVTAHDSPVDDATITRWSTALPGSSVAVLAPFPAEVTDQPPFEALLAPQPFDERAVLCASGAPAGEYPRGLITLASGLSWAGHAVSLSSLCAFSAGELLDVAIARLADASSGRCLPFPLTLRADGTPPCLVELTAPVSGRGTSCLELGLPLSREARDERGRTREVCAVPAVARSDLERVTGFYYDDFASDLVDRCGGRPYRLAFTSPLPSGVGVEVWCEEGTAPCGLDVVSARIVPRDAGSD